LEVFLPQSVSFFSHLDDRSFDFSLYRALYYLGFIDYQLHSSKMSAVQPVAVYALRVPPGGALIPAVPNAAAMVREAFYSPTIDHTDSGVVPGEHGCH
jgi:hypothetical protein